MIKEFDNIAIMSGDKDISYTELLQRINIFSSHTPVERGARTLIISENRAGYFYAFFSVWQNKGIAVPVDSSSTVSDIAYIVRDCSPACVWTTVSKKADVVAALKDADSDADIKLIDDYEEGDLQPEKAVISYDDENDTAVLIYTSGTTGSPKGVMLTFANLFANVKFVTEEVPVFNPSRRTLVLLPLHHVFPLLGTLIMPILNGGGVAICPTMSGPDIMETLCRGKVAIFVGVPRLWQTLFNGIKKKIDSNFVTRALFNFCLWAKNPAISKIIFKSVAKKMGGNLQYCISGGAALSPEVSRGLYALGINILEGYGMTETAPIISFTRPGDYVVGSVGLPMKPVDYKIEEGELCVKGPNLMKGYYNRPEETAQVIDKEGFLHTGDLAYVDSKGRIFLTGRKKEIIVLSNGKNVQPVEIEHKLESYVDMIKEVAVTQDGDMLCAIIVPQPELANGKSDEELEVLLKREVIEKYNLTVTNYKKIMNIFIYRGDIPRTRLDKIQRFKLKDILQAGNRKQTVKQTVVEPNFEEYAIIRDYIVSEKKCEVKPTDHIETDLAFDSLDRVSMQGFIEQTFGIELKADSMLSFENVQSMAEYVAKVKTRQEVEVVDWNKLMKEQSHTDLKLPNFWFTGILIARMARAFFRRRVQLEIKGLDNLPKSGPFIIAPNHQSSIDGLLVSCDLPSSTIKNTYFYVKEDHVGNMFLRFVASHHNMILMERTDLKNSILKMSEVLKSGKNLIIFPEGTRTLTGEMGSFKKTFAILGQTLNVPIVPVAISGAFDAMPKGRKLPLAKKVVVEYLPPYVADPSRSYDENVEDIKAMIEKSVV